jgi:hypothetical protein
MRRLRIVLGILILTVSLVLLIWAYKPLERIKRTQPIAPQEMQLPTPVSLLILPETVL